MKKSKLLIGALSIGIMILVAGCASSEKKAELAPAPQQQTSSHEGHSTSMPKEDPMPMMKDMDKALQDTLKQVKAGQTVDAQKSAAQMVSSVDKVMPHMMDNGLKDNLRKSAVEIKDLVNSGKADLGVIESKVKTMQDILKQSTTHLQSMKH